MTRLFTIFLLLFSSISISFASHIVGGEMYYDYLGNNQYRVYIALYRDCASTGAQYDDPLTIGIFDVNNVMVTSATIPFPGSVNLPVVFNNPCVTPPSNICTERAIYTTILTLPPRVGGYTLSYQRCCRGPNVTNLINPDDTGLTLVSHIPGSETNAVVNSSPRFINYPPLVICNNENLNFNHSATDPDGDLLTYELVTPFAGANSINPMPVPPPAPAYPLVTWASGISATVPLGGGSTTTINSNTGQLFVDANFLGLFVVGIRVNEWRNGVIINSTTRDFLFRVVNCVVQLSAIVTPQDQTPGFVSYCQGLTFTFDNQSFGATQYQWDFGVAGINTDQSTAFEPTYTFPSPGTYQVMLIANPGWPCTDTTTIDVTLNNPLNVDFNFIDSSCFIQNSTDFVAVTNGPPSTSLVWNFGPNASQTTATGLQVNNISFTAASNNVISLVGTNGVCIDSISHPIFFFQEPIANFNLPTNYECNGFTQHFTNTSQNGVDYLWDFGVAGTTTDQSTVSSPSFTFPAEGTYPITLITEIVPGCADTIQQNITVYQPLSVAFSHNDSLCITNNSFNFDGTVTGPSITTYAWNFGTTANPSSATTVDVSNVVYSNFGTYPVTLTASFLQCSETASSSVFIYREPVIGFELLDGLPCAPFHAQFVSTSQADAPILYFWDFGDGGTSNLANPTHIYPNPGQYTVTLKIITTKGCIDTLTLEKIGLVIVHPSPTAKFDVSRHRATICDANIDFIDQSSGALTIAYLFDDIENAGDSIANPSYTYQTDGMHYPLQIATNEFGCKDTSRNSLFIEPFIVYIPNTFTPDGNEFNNYFNAVLALDPVEWEMRIFNRWGEELFVSYDPTGFWDGTYEGLAAQDGLYIYKVTYVPCGANQDPVTLTGHVNLLR